MKIVKGIATFGMSLILACSPLSAPLYAQTVQNNAATAKASLAALSDAERQQLKAFSQRMKDYISMQHSVWDHKLSPTADIAKLEEQRRSLREAIQKARANAKQGDIFTPEAGDVLRKLLRATMTGPSGAKIRASLNHAEPVGPQDLKVNQVYPNLAGQPMQSVPPSLLVNLPVPPRGLEYRISGHTLSLRDSEANMVVDYLPDAIP